MNELDLIIGFFIITGFGCLIFNYNKYLEKISIKVDNFTLRWFDKRGLETHYQSWGHCGCCGKAINGVFLKDWAWGLCDTCGGVSGVGGGETK